MHSPSHWQQLPLEKRQFYLRQATSLEAAQSLINFVRAPKGWGVYASIGPNYQYAIFGRDSIEFAEDILPYFPELAREIIGVMARLQGRIINAITEEEPGKIHHEYRARHFNEQPIPEESVNVLEHLLASWGPAGAADLRYYGSADATPLFVRLVEAYVERYGPAILSDIVTHYSGERVAIKEATMLAVEWIIAKIETSAWDLLEFKRLNPRGLPYQAWKDSETAFLHQDGTPANADGGIASLEVQGFAYDALRAGCRLFEYDAGREDYIFSLAHKLARTTVQRLWMPDKQFFAMGLDRDDKKHTRQIQTLTSNAGLLLQTNLLGALDDEQARTYVQAIVHYLMNEREFLTPSGIRCRSLRHAHLLTFADYHGSLVTWPKDTANIAEGLRRWGFEVEARELEKRMLESIMTAGEPYEFFYVDKENHAKLHYRSEYQSEPKFHESGKANTPEPMQAWSLACFLKVMLRFQQELT